MLTAGNKCDDKVVQPPAVVATGVASVDVAVYKIQMTS